MSEYVVHFTKADEQMSAYDRITRILASQRISATNPFGSARNLTDDLGDSQHCACFSEIPLDMLDRLVRRRSKYGIGFHQDRLLASGGGRVWYLPDGSTQQRAFDEMVRRAMQGGIERDDEIWSLTPLVDRVTDGYAFEWEREWRVPGGLQFQSHDVAFLFIPEEFHETARVFLQDGGGGAGPAYACPVLDPLWDDARIQDALMHIDSGM